MDRAFSSGIETLKAVSNSKSMEIVSSESNPKSTSELSNLICSRGMCFTVERIVITFSANSSGISVPPGRLLLAGPLGNTSVHRQNRNAKAAREEKQQPFAHLKNQIVSGTMENLIWGSGVWDLSRSDSAFLHSQPVGKNGR